jgi:hypothetical protein
MTEPAENGNSEIDLAHWLLSALEGHWSHDRIQATTVSKFGLTEEQARTAEESARNAILKAISGSRKNMPSPDTDAIGYTTFNLVWKSFNQNSFFDKRRTPNKKWLDWKNLQESARPVDQE